MAAKPKQVATFEKIMAKNDLPGAQDLYVPQWDMIVRFRGLRRGEFNEATEGNPTGETVNARALAMALLEPKVSEAEAAQLLAEKNAGATQMILNKIMEVSGLGEGFLPR